VEELARKIASMTEQEILTVTIIAEATPK